MKDKELSIKTALQLAGKALLEIKHGEIIIKVQNGKPILVEKFERERVG